MKKLLVLLAAAVIGLSTFGCAVNSSTGSITVQNRSETNASGIKVGSVFIGYVASGSTNTTYFYKAEDDAAVTVSGFEPSLSIYSGKIELKLNYLYTLTLQKSTSSGNNIYNMSGVELGNNNNSVSLQ